MNNENIRKIMKKKWEEEDSKYMAYQYQERYERILKAWRKTEEELTAYAEKIASTYFYDSRVEATLHCLTVMRKNLEVAMNG